MNQLSLTDAGGYSPRQWKNDSKSNSEIIRLATLITGLKYKCLKGRAEYILKGSGPVPTELWCAFPSITSHGGLYFPHSDASLIGHPRCTSSRSQGSEGHGADSSEGTGNKFWWLLCWAISATEYKSQGSVATFT